MLLRPWSPLTFKPPSHLFVLAVDQGQLEAVLRGVNVEDARSALPVQAVHAGALDACDVDGQVQGADDAVIAVSEKETGQ